MRRITLGGHETLIELDWDTLDPSKGERQGIARMLKSQQHKGCRFAVVMRSSEETALGFVPADEKMRPRLPSAAAILAKASQQQMLSGGTDSSLNTTQEPAWNWIVIEPLEGDLFWMVAILKGAPVPSTDVTGPRETIIELAREFQHQSDLVVHTTHDDIRHELQMTGRVSEQGFAQLAESVINEKHSDTVPKQIGGLRLPLFLAVLAAAAIVGGLMVFSHWHALHIKELERLRAQALTLANRRAHIESERKYEDAVRQAVNQALKDGQAKIDKAMATPAPGFVAAEWASIVNRVDLDQASWSLTGIDCRATAQKQVCQVSLARNGLGIDRLLLQRHPDATIQGDAASFVLTLDSPPAREASMATLPTSQDMTMGVTSDLQLLQRAGLSYQEGASKEITQTVTMPPAPATNFKPGSPQNAAPAPVIRMGVATGTLSASGKGLWQMQGFAHYVDRTNISIEQLSVKLADGAVSGWSVNGTYYVRSAPTPTLPLIKSGDQVIALTLPPEFRAPARATGVVSASGGQGSTLLDLPVPASTSAPASGLPSPMGLPTPSSAQPSSSAMPDTPLPPMKAMPRTLPPSPSQPYLPGSGL